MAVLVPGASGSSPGHHAQGTWPLSAFHSAPITFTLTPDFDYDRPYQGVYLIANDEGGFHGWYFTGSQPTATLRLYDESSAAVFDQLLTFSADQEITVVHDHPNREVTISGATTGNGTYSYSTSNGDTDDIWLDQALHIAANGADGDIFEGTISDIEDVVTSVDLDVAISTAAAPSLTVLEVQPVSLGVAAAIAVAPAVSVSEVQPVFLGVSAASAASPELSTGVALDVAQASAAAPDMIVSEVQPVSLDASAAAADAPALSASEVQPVPLPVASALADAPDVVVTVPIALDVAEAVAIAYALGLPSSGGVGLTTGRLARTRGRRR